MDLDRQLEIPKLLLALSAPLSSWHDRLNCRNTNILSRIIYTSNHALQSRASFSTYFLFLYYYILLFIISLKKGLDKLVKCVPVRYLEVFISTFWYTIWSIASINKR